MIISNIWAKGGGVTDSNRFKKAAQWFYSTVFRDEPIPQRQPSEKLPSLLRAARSLERGMDMAWQSRESVFLKQGKLLAAYEDDYPGEATVTRYYPTYQSFTDGELRCYFTWRTQVRRGVYQKTALSFAFLYLYELINQIGAEDPMDGYRKLKEMEKQYGALDDSILPYLKRWLMDYVIFYDLPPALLENTEQVIFDKCLSVLTRLDDHTPQQIMESVKQLSGRWLARSKFYAQNAGDFDTVAVRVLKQMSAHYDSRCKKTMVEQYFGQRQYRQVQMFAGAVFARRDSGKNRDYPVDPLCVYRCRDGLWAADKWDCAGACPELENLMKTIDCVMREAMGDRHPIKPALETKWIRKLIDEAVSALLAEKKAAQTPKLTLNYGALGKIRKDAAATRDRLIVDEEEEEILPAPAPASSQKSEDALPLTAAEFRLVRCLLYGGDLGWVSAQGTPLSVLIDGVNDKLFDRFQDTVLTPLEPPQVLEDYADELKELIQP